MEAAALGALALTGVLLAHTAGYRLALTPWLHGHDAAHHHAVGHGHLVPMASGAAGLGALAVAALVVAAHRRRLLPALRVDLLFGAQVALYLGMEVLERAAQGVEVPAALGDRRVLVALALQAPVALLLAAAARAGARVLECLFTAPRPALPPIDHRPFEAEAPFVRPAPLRWALGAARRGPPAPVHV